MIDNNQLILELAAQFFLNRDRYTHGWNIPQDDNNPQHFYGPNREWYDYRDEWVVLSNDDRQYWIDKAESWLTIWREKYPDFYPLLLQYGKPVYSLL